MKKSMTESNKFIHLAENKLNKFQEKLSKLEDEVKSFNTAYKKKLAAESRDLKEKYKEAEKIVKNLKAATADNFEDIKDESLEIFSELKDGLLQFSNLLAMNRLMDAKDEIAAVGMEKISELSEYGMEKVAQATDYGKEKVSQVEDFVRKNPVTSAAAGLAIGVLLGHFLRRK